MLALAPFFLASSLISGSLAKTIDVSVGKGGLVFDPPSVTAQKGDEVVFTFFPKNHTLTQSTLAAPCTAVADGGDSGFMPVVAGGVQPTKRIIVPDDTTPLWFFCKQGAHCQAGMVFSINPKSAEQQAQFVANAKAGGTGAGTNPPPATTTDPTNPQPSNPVGPTTGGTTGNIHNVLVGSGGLTFTPDRVNAVVGDIVNFQFVAGAHTVTQAAFATPCTPLSGGVDSGPKPATAAAPVNFTYSVTDIAKPQWFYCATGTHCRQGMVFSINAPLTGNTADAWKANSMNGTSGTPPPSPDAASSLTGGVSAFLIAAVFAGLLL